MIRKKYSKEKLEKIACEICKYDKKEALHLHHIIPRCDPRSSNDLHNLACLCPNCHDLVHSSPPEITIVGVYSSTAAGGRKLLFYHGETPPPDFIPREFWKIKPEENPLLARGKRKT